MNKRIGILTFHYVDNYGAVLQAWALRKSINQLPDCQAEIINYVPRNYQIYPYRQTQEEINNLREKRKKFETFLKKYCGINSRMIHKVVGNEYDYYCVGSDQVWNIDFRENVDFEYLLPNLDDKAIRFSYAASLRKECFGDREHLFQKYLPKFRKISLREQSFVKKIAELYGQEVIRVIDPTLLLHSYDYEKLIEPIRGAKDNFLFFFVYPLGEEIRKYVPFVNTLARKYHLKVIHTCIEVPNYIFGTDAECVMNEGIQEFLWYVKHAEFVVTTSYHGLIFSVLFQKPFYLLISGIGKERLLDLIDLLDLNHRVVTEYMPANRLSDYVDYRGVNEILEAERIKAVLFLKDVLDIR